MYTDLVNVLQVPLASNTTGPINVCVGQEWYRYPSSFLLPGPDYRLQFLKTGFDGLLPAAFDADKVLSHCSVPVLLFSHAVAVCGKHGMFAGVLLVSWLACICNTYQALYARCDKHSMFARDLLLSLLACICNTCQAFYACYLGRMQRCWWLSRLSMLYVHMRICTVQFEHIALKQCLTSGRGIGTGCISCLLNVCLSCLFTTPI